MKKKLTDSFIRLKRCRDAYWKIAGEQMGLGKPWEYDMSKNEFVYAIAYQYGHIQPCEIRHRNRLLTFPTAEMRDAFKENFDGILMHVKNFYNMRSIIALLGEYINHHYDPIIEHLYYLLCRIMYR